MNGYQSVGMNYTNVQTNRGISGSTLKIIAIITMFIDHLGAGFVGRLIQYRLITKPFGDINTLYMVYMTMRFIGRIAFPIFIFLMIEGMKKTRNVWKYTLRMGIFALASEVPFDMTFNGKILESSYQNIFFTLLIGMLTIIAIDRLWRILGPKGNVLLKIVLAIPLAYLGAWIAEWLHTDYGAIGIVCIVVMYVFSFNKALQIAAGSVVFIWEVTAPFAFIPIGFYNGKRGLPLKYVFYAFYPLHLIVIYLTALLMGIAHFPAM